LRQRTGFAARRPRLRGPHFLPHLDRDNVYRILKAEG
jgi:hypothetical protein